MAKQSKSSSMLTLAACVIFSLVLSGVVNAQLVFNKSDIDGSIGQPSILDSGTLFYGLQPFPVTVALASADGIRYDAAFSTSHVQIANSNLTGLDVRTWDTAFVYLSNLTDALNGTPTARLEFDLQLSKAANGQQFQNLITTQQGPNGETHHTFVAVADLGVSIDGNPHHQITQAFGPDTTLTLQDNSTTSLGQFLTANVGQTLYVGSVINNAGIDGFYEIATTPNSGLAGILKVPQGVFQIEFEFAHQLTAIVDPVLLGDVNLDEAVTFADIPAFIAVLAGGGFQAEADCDENGEVNFADIPAFIAILASQ